MCIYIYMYFVPPYETDMPKRGFSELPMKIAAERNKLMTNIDILMSKLMNKSNQIDRPQQI